MSDNKAITFRPTQDSKESLDRLLEYYRQEFQGISKADVINKAIIELENKIAKRNESK